MCSISGQSKKTLSNNNIKCGKLFIGYSIINWITNYTTIGKYCKLINCSAWWRLMSPTAPVVPFSNFFPGFCLQSDVIVPPLYSHNWIHLWYYWTFLDRYLHSWPMKSAVGRGLRLIVLGTKKPPHNSFGSKYLEFGTLFSACSEILQNPMTIMTLMSFKWCYIAYHSRCWF